MQSVTVLTTHGRRQVVKVEPNKTILWILEEVCKKFNFDPDNFGLKHHNKLLDLSQMFRFTGLPNNSNLEMVEADKKRVEQNLVICVQLEDGTRINGNFESSSTLKSIITALCPEKSTIDQSPVVIYMRSEFFGDALDTVTLKSLGLSSGGRALLRVINTDPESLKVQANISAPLPQKPKEESQVDDKPRPRNVDQPGTSFQVSDIKRLKEDAEKNQQVQFGQKGTEDEAEAMEVEETEEKPQPEKVKAAKPIQEVMVTEPVDNRPPEPEPVIHYLDDRGSIIFSLDSMERSSLELPDSFFDLSESEVKHLYRDLKKRVDENENRPLMTAALRKLQENKKILNQLSIYKSCAIRIQMPERFVIQTKFSTVETVGTVMDYLRKFLVDPDIEFHLYVTPPKQILDKTVTLIESNCVPSALLHFGCELPGIHLKPELFEKLSTGTGASKVLLKTDEHGFSGDDAGSSSVAAKKSKVPTNFMPSKSAGESTGAVPKWFKRGK